MPYTCTCRSSCPYYNFCNTDVFIFRDRWLPPRVGYNPSMILG